MVSTPPTTPPATHFNSTPVYFTASPVTTLTPGFLLQAAIPAMPPPLISQEFANQLSDPQVLWYAAQLIPGNCLVRIPPFRSENLETWRSVVIDNVPRHTTAVDLLRTFKPLHLESARQIMNSAGGCRVEFRFLNHLAALLFYTHFLLNPVSLEGNEVLSISWFPAPPLPPKVSTALCSSHATRILYIEVSNQEDKTEESQISSELWKQLSEFGTIESIKPVVKSCGNGNNTRWSSRRTTFSSTSSRSTAVASSSSGSPCNAGSESTHRDTTPEALKNGGDSSSVTSTLVEGDHMLGWKVCFTNIEAALRAKSSFSWDRAANIGFGHDEPLSRLQRHAALLYMLKSPYDPTNLHGISRIELHRALAYQSLGALLIGMLNGGELNVGNRCICVSRLPPATRLVEICNTVRGGAIESVKLVSNKHICFVTFLEPTAAAQFWATYQLMPFYVNCERVRVGWGRNPGPLAPEVAEIVNKGVTRNVCIQWDPELVGSANPVESTNAAEPSNNEEEYNDDSSDSSVIVTTADADDDKQSSSATLTKSNEVPLSPVKPVSDMVTDEAELGRIFSPFGEIEQVRVTRDVCCSFVTFTNIVNAAQAVDWARTSKLFHGTVVQYGKDRCAALARSVQRSGLTEPILVQYLRKQLPALASQTSSLHHPFPLMPHPMPISSPATIASPTMPPVPAPMCPVDEFGKEIFGGRLAKEET